MVNLEKSLSFNVLCVGSSEDSIARPFDPS